VLLALRFRNAAVALAAYAGSEVGAWLKFHTGATVAKEPAGAAFALIDLAVIPLTRAFAQGTAAYPDRSTTSSAKSRARDSTRLAAHRTGVNGEARSPCRRCPAIRRKLADQQRRLPLGIDMVFAAPGPWRRCRARRASWGLSDVCRVKAANGDPQRACLLADKRRGDRDVRHHHDANRRAARARRRCVMSESSLYDRRIAALAIKQRAET